MPRDAEPIAILDRIRYYPIPGDENSREGIVRELRRSRDTPTGPLIEKALVEWEGPFRPSWVRTHNVSRLAKGKK